MGPFDGLTDEQARRRLVPSATTLLGLLKHVTCMTGLPLDAVVTVHRGGPRTVRWVCLQVLRELAHHCGHADILREQILAG